MCREGVWPVPCDESCLDRRGPTIDALPTRALLVFLTERGLTITDIAERSGCSERVLREIRGGKSRIHEVTALKVRAVVNAIAATRSTE